MRYLIDDFYMFWLHKNTTTFFTWLRGNPQFLAISSHTFLFYLFLQLFLGIFILFFIIFDFLPFIVAMAQEFERSWQGRNLSFHLRILRTWVRLHKWVTKPCINTVTYVSLWLWEFLQKSISNYSVFRVKVVTCKK